MTQAPPLVSIVITNHDYGRFLGEAIESALSQTHPAVEVLVIDDGSTDDSLAVAARYPVAIHSQPNRGVCEARNAGARRARGTCLVFLDADDRLEPGCVEKCLRALAAAPPRVAYAYSHARLFGTEEGVFEARPFDARRLLAGNFVHASALMRKAVFDEVGGFDPSWTLGLEDYELWIRMLSRGYTGVLVPEPLLHYRRHPGSRNDLVRGEDARLRWRVRASYPRLFWRKLVKHPWKAAYWLWKSRRLSAGGRRGPAHPHP